MLRFYLLLLLLTACQSAPPRPAAFPDDWVGEWQGALRTFDGEGKQKTVHMELHVAVILGGYQWKIIYGTGEERQVRDYMLRTVDGKYGDYEIDERNSIVLPATYRAGALISKFTVDQSSILSIYRRVGDVILFELLAGPRTSARTSGGGAVPKVDGYKVVTRQEAALRRVR